MNKTKIFLIGKGIIEDKGQCWECCKILPKNKIHQDKYNREGLMICDSCEDMYNGTTIYR